MPTEDVEAVLNLSLSAVQNSDSPNRIRAEELRDWVLEYLQNWDEEVARFPDSASDEHWDLLMADGDPTGEAVFAVAIFRMDGIEVVFGRGNSYAVREFAESDFPDDIDEFGPQLRQRFPSTGQALSFPRRIAEAWLGRSFPPIATANSTTA